MELPLSRIFPSVGLVWFVSFLHLLAGIPAPQQVELTPDRDATLHNEETGAGFLNLANGAGDYLFAGKTGADHQTLRRALLHFDVARVVPVGSILLSARLDLLVSKAPPDGSPQTFQLHRMVSDWGEGPANPDGQEGQGAAPQAGDATWDYGFFSSMAWTSPGGDFLSAASALAVIEAAAGVGATFQGVDVLRDVRHWMDTGENLGWILLGNEEAVSSARRFYSRNAGLGDGAPVLTLTYQVVPEPSSGILLGGALVLFFKASRRSKRFEIA